MRKLFATGLMLLCLTVGAWAQDSEAGADEPEAAASEAEGREEAAPEDESYVDSEDDDFRPSEEIPADQSIPFPTDI